VDQCLQVTGAGGGGGGEGASGAAGSFTKQVSELAKACTHPVLAMRSMDGEALAKLGIGGNLDQYVDISHSPKLVALAEVLQQCGILSSDEKPGGGGGANDDEMAALAASAEPAHQILVFAQSKATLDMVERCLLGPRKVPFLRIDGNVEASKRHDIAIQFQSDPTIPVLLLTTRVGGLGLNLTAADTVFFIEHDWNPMMDMQAMDRAHRLGQKKTVNVFRAVIKGSYEERLMSMQQFKIGVAETVVSMENASVQTLRAGEFVDLFSSSSAGQATMAAGGGGERALKKPKNIVEELSKNWEELYGGQYDDEFTVEKFVSK